LIVQDDTVLLVMGDHGMTEDGNHGGATAPEVEAALFMHA
jgi:GPI ethanolamine phosphate transferase 3 subunit O